MKDSTLAIPKWVKNLVNFFTKFLCIDNRWNIDIKVVRCVVNDPYTVAACSTVPNIWNCILYIRSDLEDNFYWWQTIIHELIHLSHVEVEALVVDRIIAEIPSESRRFAEGVWTDKNEKFIDSTASSLANMYEFLLEENLLTKLNKRTYKRATLD